jgi:hypothetical protein
MGQPNTGPPNDPVNVEPPGSLAAGHKKRDVERSGLREPIE